MGRNNASTETKYAYRLPPVRPYDLPGMEGWLEDLSRQGLHLSSDGFFLGFAVLQKGEGKQYRYRLEARKARGLFSDSEEADPAQVALAEDFGWEYVCRHSYFDIYRTDDPSAPELNTDPSLQALTLKRVEKELRSSLIWAILYWPLLYVARQGFFPLLSAIAAGSWFMLWLLVLVIGAILVPTAHMIRLSRFRKQLLSGETPPRNEDWKRRRTGYFARKLLWFALTFGFLLCFLIRWGTGTLTHEEKLPLSQLENIPIVTLADCFPEGSYVRAEEDANPGSFSHNYFTRWNSFLAPDALKLCEEGLVTLPDSSRFTIVLYLDYYQVQSHWEAQALARELMRYDKKNTGKNHWEALEPPEADADLVLAYNSYFPTVVLQKGKQVVKAQFYAISSTGNDADFSLETLAQTLSNSFSK